jgi:RNA methyltransferase, TrmH family
MIELPEISSRDNQRLVHARKVRDGQASGDMFVEGKRLAIEALRSGVEISECFVSERFADSSANSALVGRLVEKARLTFEIPDRVFRSVAATDHSQGVILIAEKPQAGVSAIERNMHAGNIIPITLLLYQINNPSNLGAVLRTAEASGIAGVITSTGSANVYSPKALRASMGAAFRVPVWADAGIEQALIWAEQKGLRTTATGVGANYSYTQADWCLPRLLVFGSEAEGLAGMDLGRINETINIPMENQVESLNLAVAAGIILFEAKRQIHQR